MKRLQIAGDKTKNEKAILHSCDVDFAVEKLKKGFFNGLCSRFKQFS